MPPRIWKATFAVAVGLGLPFISVANAETTNGIDLEALGITVGPDEVTMGGFTFRSDRELRLTNCATEFGPAMVAIVISGGAGVLLFGESRQSVSILSETEDELIVAGRESVFRITDQSFTATHIDDGSLNWLCNDAISFLESVDDELSR